MAPGTMYVVSPKSACPYLNTWSAARDERGYKTRSVTRCIPERKQLQEQITLYVAQGCQ